MTRLKNGDLLAFLFRIHFFFTLRPLVKRTTTTAKERNFFCNKNECDNIWCNRIGSSSIAISIYFEVMMPFFCKILHRIASVKVSCRPSIVFFNVKRNPLWFWLVFFWNRMKFDVLTHRNPQTKCFTIFQFVVRFRNRVGNSVTIDRKKRFDSNRIDDRTHPLGGGH